MFVNHWTFLCQYRPMCSLQRTELTSMSAVKHDDTRWIMPLVVLMLVLSTVTPFTLNITCVIQVRLYTRHMSYRTINPITLQSSGSLAMLWLQQF